MGRDFCLRRWNRYPNPPSNTNIPSQGMGEADCTWTWGAAEVSGGVAAGVTVDSWLRGGVTGAAGAGWDGGNTSAGATAGAGADFSITGVGCWGAAAAAGVVLVLATLGWGNAFCCLAWARRTGRSGWAVIRGAWPGIAAISCPGCSSWSLGCSAVGAGFLVPRCAAFLGAGWDWGAGGSDSSADMALRSRTRVSRLSPGRATARSPPEGWDNSWRLPAGCRS